MNARRLTVTASDSSPRGRVLLGALTALALACATALAGPAPALAAGCPNEAQRAKARSLRLPQCRAYEMVSPVETQDSGVLFLDGAAPGGEAAEFGSVGGFAGIQSNYGFNFYIARRGGEGWETSAVGMPGTLQGERVGEITSFDLTKQLARFQFKVGEYAGLTGLFFTGDLAAAPALSWVDMPQYLDILPHVEGSGGILYPEDASPDFSHLTISGPVLGNGQRELYEFSGVGTATEAARLLNIGPKGETIPNAEPGRGQSFGGSIFHAISNDGAEIFFTGGGVSYVRVNGETTHPTTLELGGLFQGASEDGSKVFLQGAGGELYMDLIDREPGHEAVSETVPIAPAGQSNTYLRSGDDGSRVYFHSTGVLAQNKNENKEEAKEGESNLYVYDTLTKEPVFIAQAEPGEEAQVNGCPSAELKEVVEAGCEGGRFFVFTSTAHITPGDTAGGRQVFEYDAKTGRLVRVSTGEGGYADNGNGNALGASIAQFSYGAGSVESQLELFEDRSRAVSDDGSTVVFSSSGALSPRAVNDLQAQQGPEDVYESHDGQVSLISTGHSLTSDIQPTITPSGRDIFFTSTEGILPQDSDGLSSLYDARIGGGFPAAAVPAGGCNGDACQGPPSVPDLLGAGASATFSGLGNPAPVAPTPAVKPKAKPKPKKCKKAYVRKKGKCVKKPKAIVNTNAKGRKKHG